MVQKLKLEHENKCKVLSDVLQFPDCAADLSLAYNANVTALTIAYKPRIITGNLFKTTNPPTIQKKIIDKDMEKPICLFALVTFLCPFSG
jgi:hypothetical protein